MGIQQPYAGCDDGDDGGEIAAAVTSPIGRVEIARGRKVDGVYDDVHMMAWFPLPVRA
jgi:hypothetical protein